MTKPETTKSMPAWGLRLVAIGVALTVYAVLPADVGTLTSAGRATAAIAALMAFLWITEAVPLAATALLPLVLFPGTGVLPMQEAARPYAHEYVFLFLGGFLLALAMQRWGLHRRIALGCLGLVGSQPKRLVAGFMLTTAFLSMWISNTACTMMMLPIAFGVLERMGRAATSGGQDTFPTCLLLGIAYAASIGGMATLIGTPPNVFLAGFLETTYGISLGFGRWMLIGLPLVAVFLPLAWWLLTHVVFPLPPDEMRPGHDLLQQERRQLGPMHAAEKRLLVVFGLTVILWLARGPLQSWEALVRLVPGIAALSDAGIAVTAAVLLFFVPAGGASRNQALLDWATAERLPWGILLLFGGGLSLATAFRESGLAGWISQLATAFEGLSFVWLVLIVVACIVFLTELTSNTATAATFLPVLAGIAEGLQRDPLPLLVAAALAASCAFMMPVATPPNAIVFGTGHLRIRQMARAGVLLNLFSVGLLMVLTFGLVVHLLARP